MTDYQPLIDALDASDEETFWFGPASVEQIQHLQSLLKLQLPAELVEFLLTCGGGGVVQSEIVGIEDNDAALCNGGSLIYATTYCRSEFGLPEHLAVIYLRDDEVCWAVDCSVQGQGRVLSYSLFQRKIERVLNPSFYLFFQDYVNLRL